MTLAGIIRQETGPRPGRVWAGARLALFLGLAAPATVATVGAADRTGSIDFGRDIRPILSDNCFACHGPDKDKRKAGLRLDLRADAFKALDSGGFALVPGQPDRSRLLQVVSLP